MGSSRSTGEHPARTPGRTRRVATLGVLALLATGCGAGAAPLPAEAAVAHYDAAADALIAELSAQEWTLNANQRTVQEEDGQCRYSPGVWEADGTLERVSGEEGWEELATRLDPVLAEHGFEELGAPSRSGALHSVATHDGHGAELVLDEQGRLSLRGALVDTTSCTQSALGL